MVPRMSARVILVFLAVAVTALLCGSGVYVTLLLRAH